MSVFVRKRRGKLSSTAPLLCRPVWAEGAQRSQPTMCSSHVVGMWRWDCFQALPHGKQGTRGAWRRRPIRCAELRMDRLQVSCGLRIHRLFRSVVGSAWVPVDLVAGIIPFVYFHFFLWNRDLLLSLCVFIKCSGIVEIHLRVLPRQPVAIALHIKEPFLYHLNCV